MTMRSGPGVVLRLEWFEHVHHRREFVYPRRSEVHQAVHDPTIVRRHRRLHFPIPADQPVEPEVDRRTIPLASRAECPRGVDFADDEVRRRRHGGLEGRRRPASRERIGKRVCRIGRHEKHTPSGRLERDGDRGRRGARRLADASLSAEEQQQRSRFTDSLRHARRRLQTKRSTARPRLFSVAAGGSADSIARRRLTSTHVRPAAPAAHRERREIDGGQPLSKRPDARCVEARRRASHHPQGPAAAAVAIRSTMTSCYFEAAFTQRRERHQRSRPPPSSRERNPGNRRPVAVAEQ